MSPRREDVVRERLRIRERDCVVDELDRLAARELRDLGRDSGSGERAVDDVRCTDGLEELLVAERRGCDYGREPGQLRELDGYS